MKKIVVAITGASGSIYAKTLIESLYEHINQIDGVAIVFSKNAKDVWTYELDGFDDSKIPFKIYDYQDFFAPFASGSSTYNYMVVCPCSMGTLAKISNGIADNLITRSADVMLKEDKKLIIIPREMPYNLIHIENMKKVMLAGAKICPASPSFYSKPETKEEIVKTVVDKILNLLKINRKTYHWNEN